jgi:hypothetical protein
MPATDGDHTWVWMAYSAKRIGGKKGGKNGSGDESEKEEVARPKAAAAAEVDGLFRGNVAY